jgi:hypothetical protein
MKNLSKGFITAILVFGLMGFIGYDLLTPFQGNAEEKAAKKEEKAVKKEDKAAAETKAVKKAAAPAKKAMKKELASAVAVATPSVTLGKKVAVDIMGAGYDPDQEVRILFTDADGMQTDIGYALEPAPKANKAGAWVTTWTVDEFIKANLVAAGAFTLTVTNNEFKPLAQTGIAFKAAPKPAESKDGEKKEKKEEKKDGEKKEEKK